MFNKYITNEHKNLIEVANFNPKEDKIAIFVGTEEDFPSMEIIEEIEKELQKFVNGENQILIGPNCFRFLILKGANNV